jgi:hypothetical protein
MAIERIEWQCPQCERRYAIPADLPIPSLCPKCQPDTEQPTPTSPGISDLAPPNSIDVAFETPTGERDTGADRYRRKYPALRVISLFYRCLAVVIILATVVAFVSGVIGVFQAEDQSARWAAVAIGLGSLMGGILGSVTVLAFAKMIQLMLDIEQNTRQR